MRRACQEGSPNVVKGALACDLPVVSVRVGDVPLRLKDLDGCEVCADERPETIAAALGACCVATSGSLAATLCVISTRPYLTQQVISVFRSVALRHQPAS